MQTITTETTEQAQRVADYEPGEEAIESTYTMIGFDAETRMWTHSRVFEDIDAAHDYAEHLRSVIVREVFYGTDAEIEAGW